MLQASLSEARSRFSEFSNTVHFRGQRVLVTKGASSKGFVAIVSVEDLRLLEELEDKIDLDHARQALATGNFEDFEEAMMRTGKERAN